jgi:CheY-like chemotaxis protein
VRPSARKIRLGSFQKGYNISMKINEGPILVVEDILNVLELLEVTLRFKGYQVITAHDGVEALEKVESFYPMTILPPSWKATQAYWLKKVENMKPALIITDILMPRMDGFAFVHHLRTKPDTRNIPVIFLSAQYITPEDKKFALSLGGTRFIEKPIDIEDFMLAIAEIMSDSVPAEYKTLNTHDFYHGYRERLEQKLRHKNTQIMRAEHLLPTLSGEQHAAFSAMLKQAYIDRETIQTDLKEVYRNLEMIRATEN